MRNLFTASVFALLFIGLPANAQKRSLAEAAKVATGFFHTEEVDAMQMKEEEGSRRLQKKGMDYASDAYYMFRNKEDNRLVVISGDQRMRSILGYTDNAIEDNMMPDGLAELLTTYKRQYAALSPDCQTVCKSNLNNGERLLKTPDWGQWAPFNLHTPLSYPTGCAATAMSIVMRYHQWPVMGQGSKTHIWKDSVMTADFEHTRYDWDNMPMSYDSYTTAQAEAVSLLMRHAGIAVEMYYAAESSGARQSLVPGALTQYFRYAATTRLVSAADYDAATWEKMMRSEIDADRPVIYTGESTMGRGSHGFVLDGYRDNLFHFNFGWNGSGNGYFAISAFSSTSTAFEFANQQQAVIGIKPLREDNCAPLTLECEGKYEGFYSDLTTLTANTSVSIHLSSLTALRQWNGKLRWELCDAEGNVKEAFDSKTVSINGGNSQPIDFSFAPSTTAIKGSYLRLMACENGKEEWTFVLNAKGQEVRMDAYERRVPVVEIISDMKNATLNDHNQGNVCFEGKPLLGSTYTYNIAWKSSTVKNIVQQRFCGEAYWQKSDKSVMLTADTLYIKAKAYERSQLVQECQVNVEKPGQLEATLLKATPDADAVESLTITGSLDDNDLTYLSTLQTLKKLNLENATIQQGLFGAPFKDFSRLETCELPRSLKQIGSETFKGCALLKTISLPVSLQATGNDILSGCQKMTDIYVRPSSPDCVATDAFRGLPNPQAVCIHVQQGLSDVFRSNAKWSMFSRITDDLPALPKRFACDGIEYRAIYQGDGNFAEVTIPSGEMYSGAIVIPATVTYQDVEYVVSGFDQTDGLSPFVGNPFITSLDLQLHVDTLRRMQFMGCTQLASLSLPSTLRYIEDECFRNCPMLTQISLPASLEALGDNAFCGCQFLTDIYCYAMVPPAGSEADNYPFAQCRPQNVMLHVPSGTENLYRTTGFWTRFSNVTEDLPADVTAIGNAMTPRSEMLPIKSIGKQYVTIRLNTARTVCIYSLNGTLRSTLTLPQGESQIWINEPSIIR
ncbi:C10 family peptidase [uncultured Prevotella sp.]|uniref:C10 family peptidase n=1 Tax=uncultured Prevotella sp. TaxID=159272 RepID=UPI0026DC13C1|nr:C10 family peptidase [uncultured Prevotella sp.]